MGNNNDSEKTEVYLYKWRLLSNTTSISVGVIVNVYALFFINNINSLIIIRVSSALLILAGLWHILLMKAVPLICSLISWVLTWFAYFLAYDDLILRMWSYVFIGIGTSYLCYALLEFGNRLLEKEFGKSEEEPNYEFLTGNRANKKTTLYVTISSIICILLFMGIISYHILSTYRAVQ